NVWSAATARTTLLPRRSTATVGDFPLPSGALGGDVTQEPESAIDRVAVRKGSGHVGLEENQLRSRCRGLVVLAAYGTLQGGEVVFTTQVVTASLHRDLPTRPALRDRPSARLRWHESPPAFRRRRAVRSAGR